jgi:HSF-type DNA-binding
MAEKCSKWLSNYSSSPQHKQQRLKNSNFRRYKPIAFTKQVKLTVMSPEEIAVSALAGMDAVEKSPEESKPAAKHSQQEGKPKRRGPKPKVKLPVEPRVIQTIPKRKEYVNHSYSDFSIVPQGLDYERPTKIEDMSFSEKVHDILAQEEFAKYISWRPHGRAFCITIPGMFEKHACQKYFGHKRYSSFLRQINNHGFKHLTKGPDRNCYYHEVYIRIFGIEA